MASLPHSMDKTEKDGATWELIRGFKYSGKPFPPGCILSSANLLYREDFPQSTHGVDVTLLQTGQSALGWLLEGVRVWKLNRTYHGEKPSSLSLPTEGCWFALCNLTQHLLAIPNILVEMRSLYEGPMTRTVPPAQRLRRHLSQENLIINKNGIL